MKKLILMLILVATIVMGGFEKDEFDQSSFHSGVKLGLTYSNAVGDDAGKDNQGTFGFELGAFILHPINDMITFQPEILFTQKGYSEESTVFGINYDNDYTLNYLQVPLLLSFKTAPGLKVYGGGYVSYFMSASVNFNHSGSTSDAEKSIEKLLNDFDAGIVAGVMFRGNNNLLFDLRFERGFSQINKDGDLDIFNQSFKLSVGWLF